MDKIKIEYIKTSELKPYGNNPRINDNAVDCVLESIKQFGFTQPIIIDEDKVIVCGHTRLKAALKLGIEQLPCIQRKDLSDEQIKAFRLADNKVSELATWDLPKLDIELDDIEDIDMSKLGFDLDLSLPVVEGETQEDNFDENEIDIPKRVKRGDIWQLGEHRLMCGDSTKEEIINLLLGNNKADLIFADPPYGMKKEKDGVLNDNLNFDALLEFNKKWISIAFNHLKDNGSFYCWGIDEPLMDIYSNILKPMIKKQLVTFRNLITWDKGSGQGENSDGFRMYAIADEKCLFVMAGVQGFNNNADNYFEAWEPIRKYLESQRLLCGWDIPTMKRIAGHSDLSRDHWTSKSQWSLLPEYVYKKFQAWARENKPEAFKKEYEEIKKEYEEIKKEYYATRAYFNNTDEIKNNVWKFDRVNGEEKSNTYGHATPKPIALCCRAINTSSRENETVYDPFCGSGSALMACEQLGRKCYAMELDEHYCDVIIKRWEDFTKKKAIKLS